MGLLAPLYIVGMLAIGVPILLHLIKRTPQGRQVFSSLMFLAPSPPRLTRRSRLTNILLLILRAAALMVLAAAFARPFLYGGDNRDTQPSTGRRIALLIDTSASMRRGDLWQKAFAQADGVLSKVTPADEVGLYFFDRRVRPGFTFEEWDQTDAATRTAMLRARLAAAAPGWQSTRLGDALAAAIDLMSESAGAKPEGAARAEPKMDRRIVLISDFQQGGHIESLQSREWPRDLQLDPLPVAAPPGNASLEWVKQSTDDETEKPDNRLRIRIANQPDSTHEQFTLTWATARGPLAGVEPTKAYVAPGRSQIVRVAAAPPDGQQPDRLILNGDGCDFDNTLFLAAPRIETLRILYLGDDAAMDTGGLRYYLQSALSDTAQRRIELIARRAAELLTDADLLDTRLVVVGGPVSDAAADRLRKFLDAGGDVLWVIKDLAAAPPLSRLLGEALDVQEAPPGNPASTSNFSLLARIDMSHPLFTPFADARFGDFTKIHFWHHRRVTLPQADTAARVVAAFDNGDPFLIEKSLGKGETAGGGAAVRNGRLLILTSGWHPFDSQLALSTKFVPLMEGMLRRKDDVAVAAQYLIGEPIALPKATGTEPARREMLLPDGKKVDLASAAAFDDADQPGIYQLTINGQETPIAVNLPPDESRTAPLPVEELEQYGIKMGPRTSQAEAAALERHLRVAELENRQKLWRWLILGVLGLLAVETALAGRLARRGSSQQGVS